MRRIVMTTGVSVMGRSPGRENGGEDRWRDVLRDHIRQHVEDVRGTSGGHEDYLRLISAETNSLRALKVGNEDSIHLLHTATPEGEVCAAEVARILERDMGLGDISLCEVAGLQVRDARSFRTEGIQNLFSRLQDMVRFQGDVVLNVTAGFKSVVPYVTLFGILNGLRIVYLFERSDSLIELPAMPISFDWERVGLASEALRSLYAEGVMGKEEFMNSLPGVPYSERGWYESLLEEDGESVTLSAFGLLMYQKAARSRLDVYLSSSSKSTYDGTRGPRREILDLLLMKIGDPVWRAAHEHSFRGTDLHVYKPGNTAERAACFLRGSGVYVCELYPSHDQYERHLPGRNQADYDAADFAKWVPPEDVDASVLSEERAFEKLLRDLEESREVCKAVEGDNAALETTVQELQRNLETTQVALEDSNSSLRRALEEIERLEVETRSLAGALRSVGRTVRKWFTPG